MNYSYEINPRPVDVGGGWRLRLLEGGKEVGGGVFPPVEGIEDAKEALQAAFDDAESEAYAWLDSRDTAADPDAHERQRRQAAVDFALANVGLSGFTPSKEVQDQMRRFIDGEVGLDEFVSGVMDHAKRTLDGHQ
jgi:hypothetical protein